MDFFLLMAFNLYYYKLYYSLNAYVIAFIFFFSPEDKQNWGCELKGILTFIGSYYEDMPEKGLFLDRGKRNGYTYKLQNCKAFRLASVTETSEWLFCLDFLCRPQLGRFLLMEWCQSKKAQEGWWKFGEPTLWME